MNGAATEFQYQTSLVPADQFWDVYNYLRAEVASSHTKVFVFVASDIDAICSLHILQELFREDQIPYSYKSVSSYEEIYRVAQNHIQDVGEISSLVFLNCGGTVDLLELLRVPLGDRTPRLYIIDSHLPYAPRNVANAARFFIVDMSVDNIAAGLEGDELPAGEHAAENGHETDDDSSAASSDEDDGADADALNDPERSHQRFLRRVLTRASRPSGAGPPAAWRLWRMAGARAAHSAAWAALVALHAALRADALPPRAFSAALAEARDALAARGAERADRPLVPVADEYVFCLHRHWAVYDAMQHSRELATALSTWRADGERKLNTLLALMGVSLEQTRRRFTELDPAQRDALASGLRQHAAQFGLPELTFASFTRRLTAKLCVSASDVVFALLGLLNAPPPPPRLGMNGIDSHAASGNASVSGAAADSSVSGDDTTTSSSSSSSFADENWYRAWQALCVGHEELLQQGIEEGKALQRAILSQAALMLSKEVIVLAGTFRYALITDYLPMFCSEGSMQLLASFLADSLVEMRRPDKPFLLCAYCQPNNAYRVLGYVSPRLSRTNQFAVVFRTVSKKYRVQLSAHGFSPAFIEVPQPEIKRFLEFVKLQMQMTDEVR